MDIDGKDKAIAYWLSKVGQAIAVEEGLHYLSCTPQIEVRDSVVTVLCDSSSTAKRVWELRQDLLSNGYSIGVYFGKGRTYAVESPSSKSEFNTMLIQTQTMCSQWASKNKGTLKYLVDKACVFVHGTSRDNDYPIRLALPYRNYLPILNDRLQERLLRGLDLNQPTGDCPDLIANAKRSVIEQVLGLPIGDRATTVYEYPWNDQVWTKRIIGWRDIEDEIVLLTEDVDSWQTEYWDRKIERAVR